MNKTIEDAKLYALSVDTSNGDGSRQAHLFENEKEPKKVIVKTRRVRSQDEFKARDTFRICGARLTVNGTVFRCGDKNGHTSLGHAESGLLKRRGKKDVGYRVVWQEEDGNLVIRTEDK